MFKDITQDNSCDDRMTNCELGGATRRNVWKKNWRGMVWNLKTKTKFFAYETKRKKNHVFDKISTYRRFESFFKVLCDNKSQ